MGSVTSDESSCGTRRARDSSPGQRHRKELCPLGSDLRHKVCKRRARGRGQVKCVEK